MKINLCCLANDASKIGLKDYWLTREQIGKSKWQRKNRLNGWNFLRLWCLVCSQNKWTMTIIELYYSSLSREMNIQIFFLHFQKLLYSLVQRIDSENTISNKAWTKSEPRIRRWIGLSYFWRGSQESAVCMLNTRCFYTKANHTMTKFLTNRL